MVRQFGIMFLAFDMGPMLPRGISMSLVEKVINSIFSIAFKFPWELGKRWRTPIQANNKKEKAELCN